MATARTWSPLSEIVGTALMMLLAIPAQFSCGGECSCHEASTQDASVQTADAVDVDVAIPPDHLTESGAETPKASPPEDIACHQLYGDVISCTGCCWKAHPFAGELAVSLKDATAACLCDDAGPCKSVCAGDEVCASQSYLLPGSACGKCYFEYVKPGGSCHAAAQIACGGAEDCGAYLFCQDGCSWP